MAGRQDGTPRRSPILKVPFGQPNFSAARDRTSGRPPPKSSFPVLISPPTGQFGI